MVPAVPPPRSVLDRAASSRFVSYVDSTVHEMELEAIDVVDHRQEPLIGDIIELYDTSGGSMVLEIAPWMNGESFYKTLRRRLDLRHGAP